MAQLPLEDLEKGLHHIEKHFNFEDEEAKKFKDIFSKYIRDYWLNGPYPPSTWNCWGRSEDLTNNHQEGYNARTNRLLRQIHPSPGILLCHVYSEIKLAEQTRIQAKVGIEKPRAQIKYLKKAKERLNIKKAYLKDKKQGKENIGEFLSAIGYNVMASMLCGKSNEVKKTTNPRESLVFEHDDRNLDTSTWIPELENDLSILENPTNPYEGRKIGKTKDKQDKEDAIAKALCSGKKCTSCGKGFNKNSAVFQCHSCDSFAHKRAGCIGSHQEETNLNCKKCITNGSEVTQTIGKAQNSSLSCDFCDYSTKAKYNMQRHIERKPSRQ